MDSFNQEDFENELPDIADMTREILTRLRWPVNASIRLTFEQGQSYVLNVERDVDPGTYRVNALSVSSERGDDSLHMLKLENEGLRESLRVANDILWKLHPSNPDNKLIHRNPN